MRCIHCNERLTTYELQIAHWRNVSRELVSCTTCNGAGSSESLHVIDADYEPVPDLAFEFYCDYGVPYPGIGD